MTSVLKKIPKKWDKLKYELCVHKTQRKDSQQPYKNYPQR